MIRGYVSTGTFIISIGDRQKRTLQRLRLQRQATTTPDEGRSSRCFSWPVANTPQHVLSVSGSHAGLPSAGCPETKSKRRPGPASIRLNDRKGTSSGTLEERDLQTCHAISAVSCLYRCALLSASNHWRRGSPVRITSPPVPRPSAGACKTCTRLACSMSIQRPQQS